MDLPFNGIGGAKKPRSGSRPSSPDNSEEVPTCFACFSKKEETGKNVVSIKQYLVICPGGGLILFLSVGEELIIRRV